MIISGYKKLWKYKFSLWKDWIEKLFAVLLTKLITRELQLQIGFILRDRTIFGKFQGMLNKGWIKEILKKIGLLEIIETRSKFPLLSTRAPQILPTSC